MPRVGLVITSLVGGGAERVVLNLVEMFQKNGMDVHIFLLENTIAYEVDSNIVHVLQKKRKKNKIFKQRGVKQLGKKLKEAIGRVESDGKQFDIIFSNLPATDEVVASADLKRKIFYIMHTVYSLELEEMRSRKAYLRAYRREKHYRKLYKGKDLISVSEGIANDFNALGIAYVSNRVIYNPFDIEAIRRKANVSVPGIPTDPYMVIVAAFREEKRIDIALKAYAELKEVPLLKILCKEDEGLSKMIRDLGLQNKVEVIGFKPNPYPYIKNAKMLIVSSEREGLSMVLIESLILGTPVVSTDCGGPTEIMTGLLSKYLAKVNDPKDLASKIQSALESYPPIEDNIIEKFKEERIADAYQKLFS